MWDLVLPELQRLHLTKPGDLAGLMHRSCLLGLPAPRSLPGDNGAVPDAAWEPEDLANFTDAADFQQERSSLSVGR